MSDQIVAKAIGDITGVTRSVPPSYLSHHRWHFPATSEGQSTEPLKCPDHLACIKLHKEWGTEGHKEERERTQGPMIFPIPFILFLLNFVAICVSFLRQGLISVRQAWVYVVQVGLIHLAFLLSQPPEPWNYRCEPPHLILCPFYFNPCMRQNICFMNLPPN